MRFPNVTNRIMCLDYETSGVLWWRDKAFSFAISTDDGRDYYYDIRRTPQAVAWLRDNLPLAKKIVSHNAKFEAHFTQSLTGLDVSKLPWECTMVRAALLDEHLLSYDLDSLGKKYIGIGKDDDIYEDLARLFGGKPTKNAQVKNFVAAPEELMARYAKQDSNTALKLWQWQEGEIERQGLRKIVELETQLLPVLVDMERGGVRVDVDRAEKASADIAHILKIEQKTLDQDAGFPVNPNPSGSIHKLFNPQKNDKGQWMLNDGTIADSTEAGKASINADCLRKMKHPLAARILKMRKLAKTKDTFLDSHILGHHDNGIVHCNINQTRGDNDAGTSCMTADTLILTNHGWLPVVEAKAGMMVIDHHGKPQEIIDQFENGVHPIYKVTTARGHTIKVTANHPFLSEGAFVRADMLGEGDSVAVYGDSERFASIAGMPNGWVISSWGRVISPSGKQRKQQKKGSWGHLKITIGSAKTVRIDKAVHRLVADAFCIDGDKSLGIVMHKNGIAWDNSIQNLAWGSCRDNSITGAAHGSYYHQSKLSVDDVKFMRECIYLTAPQLARAFSVSRELVRDIISNKKWNRRELVEKKVLYQRDLVVSVDILPPEMTYGIEVANTHTHLTNGIVTHNTGRLSINAPALQQIPARDKEIKAIVRPCFLPDVGQKWLGLDWSSFEYRVFAHYLNDSVITKRYNDDPATDFHQVVSDMTGIPRNAQYVGGPSSKALNLCLGGDIEYLSPTGWKKMSEYDNGLIAQWENGGVSFVTPSHYHTGPADDVYKISAKWGTIIATGNHRLPIQSADHGYTVVDRNVADMAKNSNRSYSMVTTGYHYGSGCDWSDDELKLLVAFQADGVSSGKKGKAYRSTGFVFKRDRKITRIKNLLDSAGISYNVSTLGNGATRFGVIYGNRNVGRHGVASAPRWASKDMWVINPFSLSIRQKLLMLDEAVHWDGCVKGWSTTYCSSIKSQADYIQLLAITSGVEASLNVSKFDNEKWNDHYRVRYGIKKRRSFMSFNIEKTDNQIVYCFTVPSSYFVARTPEGQVFISGNSMVFGAGPGKTAEMMGLPYTVEEYRGKPFLKPGPEAEAIFAQYHAAVPGVKDLLDRAASVAKSRGHIITAGGRHLRFPGKKFTHKAGGLIFQGTSADSMKQKLILVDKICKAHGGSRLLLTVHDEIGVSIPEGDDKIVKDIVEEYTRFDGVDGRINFRVPITCEWGVGDNWYEAKD